jgi:hypothetical protein
MSEVAGAMGWLSSQVEVDAERAVELGDERDGLPALL